MSHPGELKMPTIVKSQIAPAQEEGIPLECSRLIREMDDDLKAVRAATVNKSEVVSLF
jgi:hypothetical protein